VFWGLFDLQLCTNEEGGSVSGSRLLFWKNYVDAGFIPETALSERVGL
jgi:hypothetical protein